MIGGHDIEFGKTNFELDHLGTFKELLLTHWPDLTYRDVTRDWPHLTYRDKFTKEFFFYRNGKAEWAWDELGWNQHYAHDFIYFLESERDVTLVVEDTNEWVDDLVIQYSKLIRHPDNDIWYQRCLEYATWREQYIADQTSQIQRLEQSKIELIKEQIQKLGKESSLGKD